MVDDAGRADEKRIGSPPMLSLLLVPLGLVVGVLAERVATDRSFESMVEKPGRTPYVALITAILFPLTAILVGMDWVLPSYLWFVAVTVTLTLTDIDTKLIPNRILFPGTVVGAVLLTAGALIESGRTRSLRLRRCQTRVSPRSVHCVSVMGDTHCGRFRGVPARGTCLARDHRVPPQRPKGLDPVRSVSRRRRVHSDRLGRNDRLLVFGQLNVTTEQTPATMFR